MTFPNLFLKFIENQEAQTQFLFKFLKTFIFFAFLYNSEETSLRNPYNSITN